MAWHRKFTIVQNGTTQQNSTRSASCVFQAMLLDMVCKTQWQMLTVLPCFSEEDSLHCPDNECCHAEGAVNPGSIIGPATCDKSSTSELTRQTRRLWVAAQESSSSWKFLLCWNKEVRWLQLRMSHAVLCRACLP